MAQYFFNKYEREGLPKKEEKPLLKIIASPGDLVNADTSMDMINDNKLKKYAIDNPEKNMPELFSIFDYPVPRTKEEFEDPKFNTSFLYKKDDRGNMVPRENIYWNEKNNKNYQNPNDSFYSLLGDAKAFQKNQTRLSVIEKTFKKNLKRKKMDRSKTKTKIKKARKSVSPIKSNNGERKANIYKACMRHYCEKLNNKTITEINLQDIKELGEIFYLVKIANNPIEQITIWENDNNNSLFNASEEEKKNICKIKFINLLLKNSNIAKEKFGPFSWVKGDSQLIGEAIGNIKLETQKRLDIKGNNILFDEHTLFLILKVKRIKYDDILSGNQYYFKFYVEDTLIPAPIKIKFYCNCSRNKIEHFHYVMQQIKINEEVYLAFAFNPTFYFDNTFFIYQNNDIWEYVFYIDCSKANPKIEQIFHEIYNN
jgi:hypothetical protein